MPPPAEPAPDRNTGRFPSEDALVAEIVVNNAIVGICYLANRRFLWTNPRMAEMLGYAAGELDGRDVRMLYASEEEYLEVGRILDDKARTGTRHIHERTLRRKDGSLLWCMISGRFLHPEDPERRNVWVVQDMSERRQAEAALQLANQQLEQRVEERTRSLRRINDALRGEMEQRRVAQKTTRESREKYRALFVNLPLGALVRDPDGRLVESNRALRNYLGASTASRLRTLLDDPARVVQDGTRRSLNALLDQLAGEATTRGSPREFVWIRDDGEPRIITVLVAALGRRSRGTLFTFADVTEQRRASERERERQDALTHASRLSLMGQMSTALAHELGQPLNASQSYVSGLIMRLGDGSAGLDDVGFALDRIDRNLQQAAAIIGNVRDFARRRPHAFERIDVPALARQTIALLGAQMRTAGVTVALDHPPAPLFANGNPVEVQQVIANLLVNAIDAMKDNAPEERRIELTVGPAEGESIAVTVSDQGPGIPAELRARLFEPYFTTKAEGLGMGLGISRSIVESHGGDLRLEAAPRGARFRFTLKAGR